jgi:hypothetical protein
MVIILSVVAAYLFWGFLETHQTLYKKSLGINIDLPAWAYAPTLAKKIMVTSTWFFHPLLISKFRPKAVTGKEMTINTVKVICTTYVVYLAVMIPAAYSESFLVRLPATLVLILVGMFTLQPILIWLHLRALVPISKALFGSPPEPKYKCSKCGNLDESCTSEKSFCMPCRIKIAEQTQKLMRGQF